MLISEIIKELQKYDGNQTLKCLGKTTDWRFNGECSEEVDTCEWFDVSGIKTRTYGGETEICVYSDENDLH